MLKVTADFSGIEKLQRRLREIDGSRSVPLSELFGPEFMRKHTSCASFDAFVKTSPFEVESAEDLQAIPDAEWDTYVRAATRFAGWREMQGQAWAEWISRGFHGQP